MLSMPMTYRRLVPIIESMNTSTKRVKNAVLQIFLQATVMCETSAFPSILPIYNILWHSMSGDVTIATGVLILLKAYYNENFN